MENDLQPAHERTTGRSSSSPCLCNIAALAKVKGTIAIMLGGNGSGFKVTRYT